VAARSLWIARRATITQPHEQWVIPPIQIRFGGYTPDSLDLTHGTKQVHVNAGLARRLQAAPVAG
jgi:hypothetical protein